MPIRTAIVEDSAMPCVGDREPGFSVVEEAENGLDGIGIVEQHHPDIVLMNINMPVMDGIEATRVMILVSRPRK